MIFNRDQDIEFMKSTAERFFGAVVQDVFGDEGFEALMRITKVISDVYKYINLDENSEVIVYKTLDEDDSNNININFPSDHIVVSNYSALASNSSKNIVIQVVDDNNIHIVYDKKIDTNILKQKGIVYNFKSGIEYILCKEKSTQLIQPPGAISYFATPTFKQLDDALERYKIYIARRSNCELIKQSWFPENQIFFSPAPEDKLKKSLYRFLDPNMRGEVKLEQNVDDTKPVDIKITFDFSSHIALIEVKWMGKSISTLGQAKFNQIMSDADAINGASQLSNYLDLHKPYSTSKITKGYLVVFDGRRWQTNTSTNEINKVNGFHYENLEVIYDPQFDLIRSDFAKPIRFFMEPIVTI